MIFEKNDLALDNYYDLAMSFAGKDRDYVISIVNKIKELSPEIKIFYDEDYKEQLAGQELFTYLRSVYLEKATYVMCFFSENYNKSNWAFVESSAIKERMLRNLMDTEFLIPILIDNSSNYLPATIGYWAKEKTTIDQIAQMTVKKVHTGISEELQFNSIIDLADLASSLVKELINYPLMKQRQCIDYSLTDEGYIINIQLSDCVLHFWLEYKVQGLYVLLIRYAFSDCNFKDVIPNVQLNAFSCNAYVTLNKGLFTIHDFDLFDDNHPPLTGLETLSVIKKTIIEMTEGGCRCLFGKTTTK